MRIDRFDRGPADIKGSMNMRQLFSILLVLSAAALAGCGSGGEHDTLSDPIAGVPPGGPGPVASSLSLLTSSPQLPSDGAGDATITALVRDANNNVLEGVSITFSSDSGSLTVIDTQTNVDGRALATLSVAGDPTNHSITVTAMTGGTAPLTSTVTVDVTGTTLSISGPQSLAQNDSGIFTVVLTDAGGNGIPNQTVDVTSSNGNTLSSASLTTDATGQAQVTVTAAAAGADTIGADALTLTATAGLTVSDDAFSISTPAAGTEVNLGVNQTVSAVWTIAGAAQVGQTINFSTTRGALSAPSAVTDGTGTATVTVMSANAGPGTVTATNPAATSTSVDVEFVATTSANIEVQANPFTVAPTEQSAITAVVSDAANNLVKNKGRHLCPRRCDRWCVDRGPVDYRQSGASPDLLHRQ